MLCNKTENIKKSLFNIDLQDWLVNGKEHPLCVNCKDKLVNESMKLSKLKKHLETKHKELGNKSETFFKK